MKNFLGLLMMCGFAVLFMTQCSETKMTNNSEAMTHKTEVAPAKTKVTAPKTKDSTKMPWASLGDIEGLVKSNPKKIVVDVYTDWCGPCKMMDRNTFSNPEIISLMGDNFYPVKFNAEGPNPITYLGKEYTNPKHVPNKRGRNSRHQLANLFPVRGYPSLVVLDEQFKIINTITGYRTPEQLKGDLAQYMK
jgi:thioredoxin-related protein